MLLIIGYGYTGQAIAAAARAAGHAVRATSRDPARWSADIVPFAPEAFAGATHIVMTAAPEEAGDPVLPAFRAAISAAWVGYLSTTGVYGNRDGGWVDEDTAPEPASPRTRRRIAAEAAWAESAPACDIFRVAGIYGPGRSALDDVRSGRARRIVKPGHLFGRIHRDDIAQAVIAAMTTATTGRRIFNLADDEPAESAAVLTEAAHLLGVPPPPEVPFAEAWEAMSPMARSFWAENRRVRAEQTKARLGIAWRYPSYREGLRAILAGSDDEAADRRT